MSTKVTDKLGTCLSLSLQEDDVFLERLNHQQLVHLCESIGDELADKRMINADLTRLRYRRPREDRAVSQYLRETIQLALMSFEERTGLVLAGRLVAYAELTNTIYNILVEPNPFD